MSVLIVVLVIACSFTHAQQTGPSTQDSADVTLPSSSVRVLWESMHEAGMISDAQYEHVLQYGHLPGGSTVQNSPLSESRQTTWAKLSIDQLVTAEELANMLFIGKIPDMAEWEVKAFEDLAPVYQPDRRKRLTHDVRRKHQKVELIRLAHRQREEILANYHRDVERAKESGVPLRIEGDGEGGMEFIGYQNDVPLYNGVDNVMVAQTMSTDKVRPDGASPFGLTGTNVTIAIWDQDVVRTSHQEFASHRVRNLDDNAFGFHPTEVAGTLAASGVNASARGMASDVHVDSHHWNPLHPDMANYLASNGHVRVSNHSYDLSCGWDRSSTYSPYWMGDISVSTNEDCNFGRYTSISHAIDEVAYTAVYHLPVYAAGNDYLQDIYNFGFHYWFFDPDQGKWVTSMYATIPRPPDGYLDSGYDTITPRAAAKNVLSVGGVNDLPGGYSNGVNVSLFVLSGSGQYGAPGGSSRGPTDDGRIKPDIVANGASVFTTYHTSDTSYQSGIYGTSFAAPGVSGSLALLQELRERLYGTNAPMLASTVKALCIHTADDPDGIPGPNFDFGWGLMNTLAAAWVITNNAAWDSLPHIKEVALAEGEYIEFGVRATGNEPLSITMVWTDPPGTEQPHSLDPTNRVLVNDLDLRVIAPDSTTHFPWVLDPSAPTNAATAGDNIRDNVEQVRIAQPTNDWYTIRVTHKGSLSNGIQDVSIIITGNTPTNAPDFVITGIGAIGTNGVVQLEWPAVVGALYDVSASTNLLTSNGWSSASSTISAGREEQQWLDIGSTNAVIKFYRLERLR